MFSLSIRSALAIRNHRVMVPLFDTRETELHGLRRLQNDLGAKALFVVLSVLALLSLAAIFASPARADLAEAADGMIDQVSGVVETTTSTLTDDSTTAPDDGTTVPDEGTTVPDDGTTVEDNGAPSGEEGSSEPLEQIVADVIPLVADQAVEVLENVPPVVDDAIEVAVDAPPVVEEVLDVVEAGPPVVEDVLTVVGVAPVAEVVDEVRPVVADVVIMVPPQVVDVVRVLPLFVPLTVASPGPIEAPTDSAIPTISTAREVVPPSQPLKDGSQRSSGLFTKELVAEMALFHLADLTNGSAAGEPSASPVPEGETAAMAAYVPIAATMPVVGGAGASSSTGSSHSGSNSFGGLDVFSFFAAMAALLALCVVGWIRDRSRSGRSIFPSHGGRPG
jgi:hypothetical protein